jgi:hypothetical protein
MDEIRSRFTWQPEFDPFSLGKEASMSAGPVSQRERRESPRSRAIDNLIRLEWQEPKGSGSTRGRVIDASDTGALIASDVPPPPNQFLLIRVEKPVRTDWTSARVVRRGRSNEVGVRFLGCSSYAIVLAATQGIDIERSLISLPDEQRFSHADD